MGAVLLGILGVAGLTALASVGVRQLTQASEPDLGSRQDPAAAVSTLREPPGGLRHLDTQRLRHVLRPPSVRYAGTTPLGQHYVAVGLSGQLCLVTAAAQDPSPGASCATIWSKKHGFLLVEASPDNSTAVAVLRDAEPISAPWKRVGANLAVRSRAS